MPAGQNSDDQLLRKCFPMLSVQRNKLVRYFLNRLEQTSPLYSHLTTFPSILANDLVAYILLMSSSRPPHVLLTSASCPLHFRLMASSCPPHVLLMFSLLDSLFKNFSSELNLVT
ncbi:hypothetical protein Bpfe_008716 [Biomphalaria pfeifferi]|uniref:Uncharacterized protein n=1 Tax=Biomphalaria pfeifferi TaxID=112525 RepID=A0AAD8BW73_BIOPF|nr:hypothetical protein Bpfe_008716 [Biomphalaria pfeifferi]